MDGSAMWRQHDRLWFNTSVLSNDTRPVSYTEKKTKVPRSDFVILVCEEWVAVWIKMAISPEYIHVKDMWDFQISTSLTRNHRIKSPVFFEGWRAHFIPTGSASTPALVWHLAIAQRERRSETSLFALTSEAWHCLNQENVTGDEG